MLEQRLIHATFFHRDQSRAVIARVVEVCAARQNVTLEFLRERTQLVEPHRLAEEAASRCVLDETFVVELTELHELVANADLFGDTPRVVKLAASQRLADSRYGQGTRPEGALCKGVFAMGECSGLPFARRVGVAVR